jgi:hypothetical protein
MWGNWAWNKMLETNERKESDRKIMDRNILALLLNPGPGRRNLPVRFFFASWRLCVRDFGRLNICRPDMARTTP